MFKNRELLFPLCPPGGSEEVTGPFRDPEVPQLGGRELAKKAKRKATRKKATKRKATKKKATKSCNPIRVPYLEEPGSGAATTSFELYE